MTRTTSTAPAVVHRGSLHELADEYVRLANAHDLEGLVALHHPDYVSHEPNGRFGTLAEYRARTAGFFEAFPDGRVEPINVIAEDDLMVMNFIASGTNAGPFLGRPPTGRNAEFAEVRVRRVVDGLIVEQWGLLDLATLMNQLHG